MILNRGESDVIVLGDVQKFKVSIDERNINHIVTILSSNLYAHPLESFLRETISNAVDSHMEAGSKEPIVMTVADDFVAIRDYGTGISPERFQEIYINIGSSTKRNSNEYIGYFGIGRFASLAVADVVNITSFYNGKAYYYVMNKDVDQLHIDLLFEKDTDEPNGVEVKVPLNYFRWESLRNLSFVTNLYIDNPCSSCEEFNKRRILRFKNFKAVVYSNVTSTYIDSRIKVLVGNILYEMDWPLLSWDDDTTNEWKETFRSIYPCLNIGDVDITPNREALLYSEKTKTALRNVVKKCINEIIELWDKQNNTEIEDFGQYLNKVTNTSYNYLNLDGYNVLLPKSIPKNPLYKGKQWWNTIDHTTRTRYLISLYNMDVTALAELNDNTLSKPRYRYSVREAIKWMSRGRKIMAVPSLTGFSSRYLRPFLKEKYGYDHILFIKRRVYFTPNQVKEIILKTFGVPNSSIHYKFIFSIIREILKYFNSKCINLDIIGNPEYEKFKKDNANPVHRKKADTTKMCFSIYVPECLNTGSKKGDPKYKGTCSVKEMLAKVKKEHKNYRIVFSTSDNVFVPTILRMRYPHLVIICVAKTNIRRFEEALPSYIRPIEELYSEDNRVLQKIATVAFLKTRIDSTYFNMAVEYLYPSEIREKIRALHTLFTKYTPCYIGDEIDMENVLSVIPVEKYDREIIALYNQTLKYLKVTKALKATNRTSYDLEWWYHLVHNKIIRINLNTYLKAKTLINKDINKIKEALCELSDVKTV